MVILNEFFGKLLAFNLVVYKSHTNFLVLPNLRNLSPGINMVKMWGVLPNDLATVHYLELLNYFVRQLP